MAKKNIFSKSVLPSSYISKLNTSDKIFRLQPNRSQVKTEIPNKINNNRTTLGTSILR